MFAAFLSRRVRRWLLLTVGVPAGAWALQRLGEELEQRRGQSPVANGLRSAADRLGTLRR
ncbi:MAG TPA: hypothetical protein VNU01_03810 [Egibacteraceae bacterium]|nr:hypothetical protein [Egibacteraceae bacterium]